MGGLLEQYSQLLQTGDAHSIAALFAEDGEFYDDAPVRLGFEPIVVKGRDNIENFFKQTFQRGGMKVSNIAVNHNALRYDVAVGKLQLLCLGVAREEDGLIKEYRVVAA